MKVRRMTRRQSLVSQSGDFEVSPGADWEPVKLICNKHTTTSDFTLSAGHQEDHQARKNTIFLRLEGPPANPSNAEKQL